MKARARVMNLPTGVGIGYFKADDIKVGDIVQAELRSGHAWEIYKNGHFVWHAYSGYDNKAEALINLIAGTIKED